jgi:hypothetical protein
MTAGSRRVPDCTRAAARRVALQQDIHLSVVVVVLPTVLLLLVQRVLLYRHC